MTAAAHAPTRTDASDVTPPAQGDAPSPLAPWLPALALAAVTLAAYANTLGNGFVWDDNPIIVGNPATRSLAALPAVLLSPDVLRPYYRPFNRASYLIDFQIFGMNAWGFHAINVVLHVANVLLLWRLGRVLFARPEPAFIAALLFAVHPANAESVNFISARNNLWVLLFSLVATLLLFSGEAAHGWRRPSLSAVAWLLALLCKESALTMLPLWAAGLVAVRRPEHAVARRLGALVPHAACLAAYFLLRWQAVGTLALGADGASPPPSGFASNAWIIPRYVELVLFPSGLSVHHVAPAAGSATVPWMLAGWGAALAGLAWIVLSPTRAAVAGLGWLAVNFLPVANIVPIPSAPMAERYLYVPAVGLWLIVADRTDRLLGRGPRARSFTLGALGLALCLLEARTAMRNRDWRDDVSLFGSAVRVSPRSARAHANLGSAYLGAGMVAEAMAQYEVLLALEPESRLARFNLARYRMMQGRPDLALELLGARDAWADDRAALALWDAAAKGPPPGAPPLPRPPARAPGS